MSGGNVCPQCGAPIDPNATECKFCGEKISVAQSAAPAGNQQMNGQQSNNGQPTIIIQNQASPQPQQVAYTGINPAWPVKSKIVAALLAIFLGGLGIHKFYLGKVGMGIVYILLCWTFIPAIIGFFEGIIYLCSNDENFQLKHHVRLQ